MMLRLRKMFRETKGQELRYLLVSERKSSGERGELGHPHYHAFIHQISESDITARVLKAEWKYRPDPTASWSRKETDSSGWRSLGFVHPKLVSGDPGSVHYYCTDYLAKDMLSRVRSSRFYGDLEERARRWQALEHPDPEPAFEPSPAERHGEVADVSSGFLDPDDVTGAAHRDAARLLKPVLGNSPEVTLTHREREEARAAARGLREGETLAETRSRWLREGGLAGNARHTAEVGTVLEPLGGGL